MEHASPVARAACDVLWPGRQRWPDEERTREVRAQALCGLMSVHGRDGGIPRRLGLDVVSAAVGMLAAQGVLAARIARRRGLAASAVEVSALRAGALFISQHIAAATGAAGWPVAPGGPDVEPGPPFPTADGRWVELEMLSAGQWRDFWLRLGIDQAMIGSSWLPFATRYSTARCSLPRSLHAATARRSVAELEAIAAESGAALVRLRSVSEVIEERGSPRPPPPWRAGSAGYAGDSAGAEARAGTGDAGAGARAGTGGAGAEAQAGSGGAGARQSATGHGGAPPGGDVAAPLTGIRVLEATSRVQGPLAGQLLRMLGAEVTRIEPPGGDPGRLSASTGGSIGAAHAAYNRGKGWYEIDYRASAGRDAILDLAATTDVFLHNWRPGRAEELQLDWSDLRASNAALVYAHASGWGARAVELPVVATDYLVQAHMGMGELLAAPDEPPHPSRVTLVDVAGALVAVEAILVALLEREITGHGARVDTSLVSGALALESSVLEAGGTRAVGQRGGRQAGGGFDRPLPTAEGHIIVGGDGGRAASEIARVLGVAAARRGGHSGESEATVWLLERPAAEWEEELGRAGIPAAVVCSDLAALRDQPPEPGLLEAVEGGCWAPAAPWRFRA